MSNHKVYALVTLGNPTVRCARYGICAADLLKPAEWHKWEPSHFRTVKAVLSTYSGAEVRIRIPDGSMLPETDAYFFGSGIFKVEEIFHFSPKLASLLGLKSLCILPGHYPVRRFSTGAVEWIISQSQPEKMPLSPGVPAYSNHPFDQGS